MTNKILVQFPTPLITRSLSAIRLQYGLYRLFVALAIFTSSFAVTLSADNTKPAKFAKPVKISVAQFYRPNNPESGGTQRLIQLMRTDHEILLEKWGGISLPGGGAKAALMMSIAVWLYQASIWWDKMPWVVSAGFVVASIPIFIVFVSTQKMILRGIIIPSMK